MLLGCGPPATSVPKILQSDLNSSSLMSNGGYALLGLGGAGLRRADKVAIRKAYRDWVFVVHFIESKDEYGWVQRSALVNCQAKEGTP